MQKAPETGPIAIRHVTAIEGIKRARVIDLRGFRDRIFAGYAGHVTEAVFPEGLPDVSASLPDYSPRTR
ncbi:MAG TPA: hypothetical protein PLI95_14510 [Polyangiaceae bacterium]|nr:hypothetical protein [Polyangiaceae bacterium]